MLDETLSLLEFPISVQANDLPAQTLGALAVISHPLALSIEPKTINLGFVNTFETVVEEFWLQNHTVVPLNFGFINIPQVNLLYLFNMKMILIIHLTKEYRFSNETSHIYLINFPKYLILYITCSFLTM